MRRYRLSERQQYEPPGCDQCGVRVDQSWVDVTVTSDPEWMYTPGRWECRNPGCIRNPRADTPPDVNQA